MQKIWFGLFVSIVLLLAFLEANEPQPLNWNPSYAQQDKIPLGAHLLFQNLKRAENLEVQQTNVPPYEQLDKDGFEGTYFFLNDHVGFDDAELEKLLNWVSEGNDLFISSNYIGAGLLDTLNLEIEMLFLSDDIDSKPLLTLANPSFKSEDGYLFDHNTDILIFEEIDTLNTQVLGFAQAFEGTYQTNQERINFVETDFGDGKIMLHLAPEAFSNYFLVSENNYRYAEQALSYLDTEKSLHWDNYYKSGKTFHTSPLYVFLQYERLKWAYYFAILGCLLFIIFEGKRKQRSIPVVEPLKNQTYNYTRTIAGLYLDKKQYREMAAKKIELFLEYIRTKLRVHEPRLGKEFYQNVAARSGNSLDDTKALFEQIKQIESKKRISKQELLDLSEAINTFKNATHDGK